MASSAKQPKRARDSDILAKAPLAEVVFEVRWKLVGDANRPVPLHVDPGFGTLADLFGSFAAKAGFPHTRSMMDAEFLVGHSPAKRYYTDKSEDFPIWQIGPGIFAANQSQKYNWSEFKKFSLQGLRGVISSYPKLKQNKLTFTHCEIRYIDIFDESVAGTANLVEFLKDNTRADIKDLDFFKSVGKLDGGRIVLGYKLNKMKKAGFLMDFGTALHQEKKVFKLESKIVSKEALGAVHNHDKFLSLASKWLEDAHSITSPFFKWFVQPKAMEKFK